MFEVVDDIDDSPSTTSRFLVVPVVDELDDAFDAAENDDGDVTEDEFVDDREDTVEGVESDGCNTTKDEPMTSDMVLFFFMATAANLPCFVFFGGLLLLFAMLR